MVNKFKTSGGQLTIAAPEKAATHCSRGHNVMLFFRDTAANLCAYEWRDSQVAFLVC